MGEKIYSFGNLIMCLENVWIYDFKKDEDNQMMLDIKIEQN